MIRIPPWGLILIGFLLMLVGVILPFLMVTKAVDSTFFLNFFSYGVSITGMFISLIGVASVFRGRNK